jgi:hypothetical protein
MSETEEKRERDDMGESVEPASDMGASSDMAEPASDMAEPASDMAEPASDVVEPASDMRASSDMEPASDVAEPASDVAEPASDVEPASDMGESAEPASDVVEPASDMGESADIPVLEESVSKQMSKDKKVVDDAAKFRKKLTHTKKRLPQMTDSEKDDIRNGVINEYINILKVLKHATTRKKMGRRINNLRKVFNDNLDLLNGTAKKRPRKRKTQKQPMENPPTETFSETQS